MGEGDNKISGNLLMLYLNKFIIPVDIFFFVYTNVRGPNTFLLEAYIRCYSASPKYALLSIKVSTVLNISRACVVHEMNLIVSWLPPVNIILCLFSDETSPIYEGNLWNEGPPSTYVNAISWLLASLCWLLFWLYFYIV